MTTPAKGLRPGESPQRDAHGGAGSLPRPPRAGRRWRPICSGGPTASSRRPIFYTEALPLVVREAGAEFGCVATLVAAKRQVMAAFGAARSVPLDLLTDALDRETALVAGGWVAAPLARHASSGEALLSSIVAAATRAKPAAAKLAALAAMLGCGARGRPRTRAPAQPHRPAGSDSDDRQPVEPDQRDGAAAGANGRSGHAAARRRSGQHLSVGPAEPHAGRPAGAGRARGRAAHSRRHGHRRPGRANRRAAAHRRRRQPRRSIARSIASWAIRRARCCACRCAAAGGELFGAFEVINKLAGRFHGRRRSGARRTGRRTPRSRWRTRSSSSNCCRAIGTSSSRRPKACS